MEVSSNFAFWTKAQLASSAFYCIIIKHCEFFFQNGSKNLGRGTSTVRPKKNTVASMLAKSRTKGGRPPGERFKSTDSVGSGRVPELTIQPIYGDPRQSESPDGLRNLSSERGDSDNGHHTDNDSEAEINEDGTDDKSPAAKSSACMFCFSSFLPRGVCLWSWLVT